MLSSSKYDLYILMYINVSPHLDCYSVGTVNVSMEDFAVGLSFVIQTVLFPYPDRNGQIKQTKFIAAVFLQRPTGSRSICVGFK